MRKIKFRAWNPYAKAMYEVDTLHIRNRDPHGIDAPNFGRSQYMSLIYQPKTILMQYIGMKDINDEEIYDQDIVEYLDGEFSFTAIVEWANYGWYMKGIDPNDNFSFEDIEPSSVQRVGNKYENPKLLEVV